jgi:hypothetical protein
LYYDNAPTNIQASSSKLFFQLLETIEQILEAKGILDEHSSFTLI